MIAAEPAIDEVSAAVYVIPTDAPEARLLGLPLARLLGRIRDDVPVYGSGGFTSYDEQQTREQLAGWVERDRNPRVKIKIDEAWGTNVRRDLERVALAREIIGQDTELYVDANGAYTTGQAVRVGHQLADFGVSWFEEPVSSDDLAGLAAVREAGAVDCLQLDVTRGAAASASSCAAQPLRPGTACRCPRTAPRICMHLSEPPPETCGTSSTSMTTSAPSS